MIDQIREAAYQLAGARVLAISSKNPVRVFAYLTQEGFKQFNDDIINFMKSNFVVSTTSVVFNPEKYRFTTYMFPEGVQVFVKSEHSGKNTIRIDDKSIEII